MKGRRVDDNVRAVLLEGPLDRPEIGDLYQRGSAEPWSLWAGPSLGQSLTDRQLLLASPSCLFMIIGSTIRDQRVV